MNKNDKKYKTILSRSVTEKGERRIIVPSESGSSCECKITEKKMAQQVKHCTDTQRYHCCRPATGHGYSYNSAAYSPAWS